MLNKTYTKWLAVENAFKNFRMFRKNKSKLKLKKGKMEADKRSCIYCYYAEGEQVKQICTEVLLKHKIRS